VPLAVKSDDDIAAVPQRRSEVNCFAIDAARNGPPTRWHGIAAEPMAVAWVQVFEIVRKRG